MMRDDNTTAQNDQNNWFEYAYYSSAAVNGSGDDDGAHVKPLRLQ